MEQSHLLNRVVTFTEIPGSPKLPAGTKITFKPAASGIGFDAIAITPQGHTYEFTSSYIDRLVKTPWVNSTLQSASTPSAPETNSNQNPYTIGDVASVESGIQSDTLAPLDVTGSSTIVDKKPESEGAKDPEGSKDPEDAKGQEGSKDLEGVSINADTMAPLDVTGTSSTEDTPVKTPKAKAASSENTSSKSSKAKKN